MTTLDKIEQLQDIADSLGAEFRFYSGRSMYGRKCPAIITDSSRANRVIEMAAQDDIVGSRTDSFGRGDVVVVYYPGIKMEENA